MVLFGESETIGRTEPTQKGWTEAFDEQSQQLYYYHTETGEYRWEKPSDFEKIPESKEKLASATDTEWFLKEHERKHD